MKLIDLIQELDGAGLVITDPQEIEAELVRLGYLYPEVNHAGTEQAARDALTELETLSGAHIHIKDVDSGDYIEPDECVIERLKTALQ